MLTLFQMKQLQKHNDKKSYKRYSNAIRKNINDMDKLKDIEVCFNFSCTPL